MSDLCVQNLLFFLFCLCPSNASCTRTHRSGTACERLRKNSDVIECWQNLKRLLVLLKLVRSGSLMYLQNTKHLVVESHAVCASLVWLNHAIPCTAKCLIDPKVTWTQTGSDDVGAKFVHFRFGLSNRFDPEFPQGLAAKVSRYWDRMTTLQRTTYKKPLWPFSHRVTKVVEQVERWTLFRWTFGQKCVWWGHLREVVRPDSKLKCNVSVKIRQICVTL